MPFGCLSGSHWEQAWLEETHPENTQSATQPFQVLRFNVGPIHGAAPLVRDADALRLDDLPHHTHHLAVGSCIEQPHLSEIVTCFWLVQSTEMVGSIACS